MTTRSKKGRERILSNDDISLATDMIPKESFPRRFDHADKDEYDGSKKSYGSSRKTNRRPNLDNDGSDSSDSKCSKQDRGRGFKRTDGSV